MSLSLCCHGLPIVSALSGFAALTHAILAPNTNINLQLWSASWCNMTMWSSHSMLKQVKCVMPNRVAVLPCRSWAVVCSQISCLLRGVSCGRAQSSRLPTVQLRHRKQSLWGHGLQLQLLAGCGQHNSILATCSIQVINIDTYTWHVQFVFGSKLQSST